ncbi:glycosyl transferase family protein [Sphingomonas naphthae]|uniref:Glycosyl transferase family protein n=1 Tax=Sphingomonas naphthae TaxID=1813468 RepID=A0ABY7TNW9_9SPHN|nr:glycosyl transferase family protein [Sphingomonas naphthae]WCT73554.1 glycosyl transferase family protein [Sphingomonas naphthae]
MADFGALAGAVLAGATYELMLFAAVGLAIGGIDDLAVDLIWLARAGWRRVTVYRRHPRMTAADLPPPDAPGRIAVFVGAWREAEVIGPMLRAALDRYDHADYRLYVGVYPNDPDTQAAIRAVDDARITMVGGTLPGPTTKAECLNRLWRRLLLDERIEGRPFKAVVLHDAEDVVHPAELKIFDRLIERFDLVQLPVLPLIEGGWRRFVSGHYADEFAEAHGRTLIVREALGAGVPSAGVGCAIARAAMARMAEANGGRPFDEGSLTEDYEMGLRLANFGGRGVFVSMRSAPGGALVAVRAYFPASFDTAVRQKTRWLTGIALAGWDRLGWAGGLAEGWMRLRDRRSILAAVVTAGGYGASLLLILSIAFGVAPAIGPWFEGLLWFNFGLLFWRAGMRMAMVTRLYGLAEGARSLLRIVPANIIAMAAARRAVMAYLVTPEGPPRWDKTRHHFPRDLPCG